ncbi:amine oxidase [alpha proteobacterium IMCC14465]|uniref:Amine oxidase n=1 Tax=alpha proteobacterium IMCC14465 TaxID=1220535 RepID=J9E1H8_9PROT|nr:amine oxidase [alpha proteobacterium IMCC14465]
MKIAIIGAGISGNFAAYKLSKNHDVTVYEKRNRLGGHSATIDVDYDGEQIAVDTGFIVYNELNYPGLTSLFAELGVETTPSNMSFAFSSAFDRDKGGLEWSGDSLNTIFAQRKNLFSPSFWLMLKEILRFNKIANSGDFSGAADESLGDWLKRHNFSENFKNRYLIPMGAAIWSTPSEAMNDFPAKSFLHFFINHKLTYQDRPEWRTVKGGSREYVKKLTAASSADFRVNAEVTKVTRQNAQVQVYTNQSDNFEIYDAVVFAAHTNQSLCVLEDTDKNERDVLSDIKYLPNQVYLHRDRRLMPKREKVWSSWNYLNSQDAGNNIIVTVSYWMNRLQNINKKLPLFVTLNPSEPPAPELTFGHYEYDHPQFDGAAFHAQSKLAKIQGNKNTWFCGAWAGFGFHEDGLQSAQTIVNDIESRNFKENKTNAS